ncbi:hypothetical protein BEN71_16400 [Acinetobacter wuhouensis]|uniref:hypothetical protein n=1 Tax=Acinetobacter TaxID=469 RepID=UPI00083A9E81|nr:MULTISPECIES: hypothetical protein [Acinetobacter]AXQ23552.1 hypothetical protein BEN71_16400 [Acinetobacter wuhouensis]RZG72833.1 hypothetical protein EXE09_16325 [Acinetobacter sp. WCHAc060025]
MKKYTDGYYIYQHVDFVCHFNLHQCDGCNRTMTGFVYELQIQSFDNEAIIFCAECMEQLELVATD